jgi:hypothetical protein
MITQKHTQESLSRSYIHAIAGSAGVNLHIGREFDYGFDGTFRPVILRDKRRVESGFHIDFQLKCTTKWNYEGAEVAYNIETKTYNDFVSRLPVEIGCVLIILCVPEDDGQWVDVQEQHMILKHCCYFCSLSGTPTGNENSTKKILIPRSNLLTAPALRGLLEVERARQMKRGES